MKKLVILFSIIVANRVSGQVSIGAEGMSLAAGTTIYSEGLTLVPQGPITLTNSNFQNSPTPVAITGSINSIPNVVTLSTPLVFTGTVRFYYQEADLNGSQESQLMMALKSSGAWALSPTATLNTTDNYIEDVLSSQTIEAVSAAIISAPLPVSLISFTAKRQANASVLLQWKTEAEQQNSHFAVERSGDGIHYQTIGTVPASVGATGSISYSFPDNNPLAGINYYRLKQYDLDGREHLYGVRIVQPGNSVAPITLYPNPVSNFFKLQLPTAPAKPLNYSIQNAAGQVVQIGLLYSNEQWLQTSGLSAGVYVLKLENGQAVRFFKQ
jgi:hypothetical protein